MGSLHMLREVVLDLLSKQWGASEFSEHHPIYYFAQNPTNTYIFGKQILILPSCYQKNNLITIRLHLDSSGLGLVAFGCMALSRSA